MPDRMNPRLLPVHDRVQYSRVKRMAGGKLQARRRRWFHLNPLCVHCTAKGRVSAATELDHIVRLEDGGDDSESNLQGLCHDCHLAKSLTERGYDQRPKIGADGFEAVE